MKKILFYILTLLLLAGVDAQRTQQLVTGTFGSGIKNMYLSLPKGWTKAEKCPLFIFLHGTGEPASSGKSPTVLRNLSAAGWIEKGKMPDTFFVNGKSFRPIIVSPQLPSDVRAGTFLQDFRAWLIKNYNCDPDKIYEGGLSQGGGGVEYDVSTRKWTPGNIYVEVGAKEIAAFIAMCGNLDPRSFNTPAALKATNTHGWFIHNSGDPTVPASLSQFWYDNTKSDPYTKLTIFQAAGHNCWDRATDPNLPGGNIYTWALGFKKVNGITVIDSAVYIPPVDTVVVPPKDTTTVPPKDSTAPVDTVIVPVDTIPAITIKPEILSVENVGGDYPFKVTFSAKNSILKAGYKYRNGWSWAWGVDTKRFRSYGYRGGGSVISPNPLYLKPGYWTFTASVTVISPAGKEETVSKDFSFEVK